MQLTSAASALLAPYSREVRDSLEARAREIAVSRGAQRVEVADVERARYESVKGVRA